MFCIVRQTVWRPSSLRERRSAGGCTPRPPPMWWQCPHAPRPTPPARIPAQHAPAAVAANPNRHFAPSPSASPTATRPAASRRRAVLSARCGKAAHGRPSFAQVPRIEPGKPPTRTPARPPQKSLRAPAGKVDNHTQHCIMSRLRPRYARPRPAYPPPGGVMIRCCV